MLQEPNVSKGPGLPTSIHSTLSFIKSGTPTLMRFTPHHGITEFSDLGVAEPDSRYGRMDVAEHGGFGLFYPVYVGWYQA